MRAYPVHQYSFDSKFENLKAGSLNFEVKCPRSLEESEPIQSTSDGE